MGDTTANLIYLAIVVFVIGGGWLFSSNRPTLGASLQMALLWGLIFVGAMIAYQIWSGAWGNSASASNTENSITVPRSVDGHYYLTLKVNDQNVEFLVDTGATDVVLTRTDAKRVGIDVDGLAFLGTANTANGEVPIARTRLNKVELGPFVDRRILASVNGGEMFSSLLGMSYLGRFDRIEISGNNLILHRD